MKVNILWKIYFVLVVIGSVYGFYDIGFGRVWEIIDFPITVLAYIGLFCFCWKKNLFRPIFWKIFFFFFILWNITCIFFIPPTIKYVNVPQWAVAVTTLGTYTPLMIALYLYAFVKNGEVRKKKRIPIGVKIISVYFIMILILFLVSLAIQGFQSAAKHGVEHMPQPEKVKLIQTPQYKKLNIKSVDDFDRYWAKQSEKLKFNNSFILFNIGIIVILLWGLWNLQEWGRLGMIIYSIYAGFCQLLSFHFQSSMAYIGLIPLLPWIFIVVYLTRPKVKNYFKQSSVEPKGPGPVNEGNVDQ